MRRVQEEVSAVRSAGGNDRIPVGQGPAESTAFPDSRRPSQFVPDESTARLHVQMEQAQEGGATSADAAMGSDAGDGTMASMRRVIVNEDVIGRLQHWFQRHCDESWENDYGISIESTDNPGWWVKVDLAKTELADKRFEEVRRGNALDLNPEAPWMRCYVDQDQVFNGAGDPTTLNEILQIFLEWAEG